MPLDVVRSHLELGEWVLARAAAVGAIAGCGDADPAPLYGLLARAEVRLGRPREASAAAEQAPHDAEGTLARAEADIANGRAPAARAALSDVIPEAPHLEIPLTIALAESCRAAGDPETGLGLATRAVALAEALPNPDPLRIADPLRVAEALHTLGVCLHGAGQPGRARTALRRSLTIRRELAADALVALTLDALGRVRRKLGEPFRAVAHHEEALALWIRAVGPKTAPVAGCRHSLAQALHNTGDFLAARDEIDAAWRLTSRTLGPDHVDTQITAFELGRFEVDVGQVEEGLGRMTTARDRVREQLGREHPVVRAMDRWL